MIYLQTLDSRIYIFINKFHFLLSNGINKQKRKEKKKKCMTNTKLKHLKTYFISDFKHIVVVGCEKHFLCDAGYDVEILKG